MTLDKFIKKYNGKKVECVGAPKYQCVDLCNKWLEEGYGMPPIRGNAKTWAGKKVKGMVWIPNKPWNWPNKGDIIVWTSGKYGHVAIAYKQNVFNLTSFDQNFPLGSASHLQKHNYKGVAGWLHRK